ncbi:MAG: D-alanyl-D-alanine carboxypeptidase family protein [Acutalibacter sp.]|jgi:D-alanyl-D-alanine carboxypeptidase (penicillin-binding protein 5/6)
MSRRVSQNRGRDRDIWSSSPRRRASRSGRRRGRGGKIALFLVLLVICGAALVPWAMRPESLRPQKNWLQATLYGMFQEDSFQGDAMLLADLSDGSVFASKGEEDSQLPASLAKLFVVEYALTLADPATVVTVSPESLALVKEGSSMAWIQARNYPLKDLFAAMLVPSGNDAAYAVADYCGGLVSPESAPGQERVNAFLNALAGHLAEKGYTGTALYDPSGFDLQARTTAEDLYKVTSALLEYPWFREIVGQRAYTAVLSDGFTQTWENTNAFLNPDSPYYDPNVQGVKTGSLEDSYNLVVLYHQHGKDFLVCALGSDSDEGRYEDVAALLRTIDESSYLAW